MVKRTKILIGTGIAVVAVGLGSFGAVSYVRANNPENILYSALAAKPADAIYISEELVKTDGVTGKLNAMRDKDGHTKVEGDLTCTASSDESGKTTMDMTVRQIDTNTFIRFNEISMTETGDVESEAAMNKLLNDAMAGKWLTTGEEEKAAKSFKEDRIFFDMLGAVSYKMDQQKLADKLREHKVITVINSSSKEDAIEYTLSVRRSAYEKFMNDVAPNYDQKSYMLDTLFSGDTEEVTATVDKKTKKLSSSTYRIENICAGLVGMLDPTASEAMPEKSTTKVTYTGKNDVTDLEIPKDLLTQEEFLELMMNAISDSIGEDASALGLEDYEYEESTDENYVDDASYEEYYYESL